MKLAGLLKAVGALAVATLSLHASGQTSQSARLKLQESCASMDNDQARATEADDWISVIRIKDRYLRVCQDVASDSDLARAHRAAGFAHVQLRQFPKALESANACIELAYSNEVCHIIKTEALLRSKRLEEGRAAHAVASKLVEKGIERARQDERDAKDVKDGKSGWKYADERNDTLKNLMAYDGYLKMLAGEFLGHR